LIRIKKIKKEERLKPMYELDAPAMLEISSAMMHHNTLKEIFILSIFFI